LEYKKKSLSLKVKPDIYGQLSAIKFVQKTRISSKPMFDLRQGISDPNFLATSELKLFLNAIFIQ